MLTAAQLQQRRAARRAMPSLRRQYEEYLLQRIEAYKNSLRREELIALGDEAVGELQAATADQFLLTEVLMQETVDKVIAKRLRLPSYAKWRKQFAALRQAQREPVHWGINPASALVSLLPRIEMDDQVLVIGGGLLAESCLLAAYDAAVTFVDGDLAAVDQIETRMAGEALSGRFLAYVASLGDWLPTFTAPVHLVVLDAGTLSGLSYRDRQALILQARDVTAPGGVHVILPGDSGAVAEAYVSHYGEWVREPVPGGRPSRGGRSVGVILCCPAAEEDSPASSRLSG